MVGSELRVVDLTRDEVSDDCWHSVYRERALNTVLGLREKKKRTLGIKEDSVLSEMWPLKYAP